MVGLVYACASGVMPRPVQQQGMRAGCDALSWLPMVAVQETDELVADVLGLEVFRQSITSSFGLHEGTLA